VGRKESLSTHQQLLLKADLQLLPLLLLLLSPSLVTHSSFLLLFLLY
jgi:hypothetical protein